MGGDDFLLADRSHAFAGLGLDTDLARLTSEDLGNATGNLFSVGAQLWSLGLDHAIEIFDSIAGIGHLLPGQREHLGRVAVGVFLSGVWKQLTNIAQRRRAEQCVGDSMQQDIGVRMADQFAIVGDVDSP